MYRKGEIPKYLKEMKLQEEERNRLASLVDVNCPPGHTVLSEDERLESLQLAQKSTAALKIKIFGNSIRTIISFFPLKEHNHIDNVVFINLYDFLFYHSMYSNYT